MKQSTYIIVNTWWPVSFPEQEAFCKQLACLRLPLAGRVEEVCSARSAVGCCWQGAALRLQGAGKDRQSWFVNAQRGQASNHVEEDLALQVHRTSKRLDPRICKEPAAAKWRHGNHGIPCACVSDKCSDECRADTWSYTVAVGGGGTRERLV